MPALSAFEYAVIRLVPRVERGEFINVGVVMLCRQRRFLDVRSRLDPPRLHALWPGLDLAALAAQLDHLPLVCAGGRRAGPIGELPIQERFRWLTAPRSTVLQPSPVHCGLCAEPAATLDAIFQRMAG